MTFSIKNFEISFNEKDKILEKFYLKDNDNNESVIDDYKDLFIDYYHDFYNKKLSDLSTKEMGIVFEDFINYLSFLNS